jgi:hypothetical protein
MGVQVKFFDIPPCALSLCGEFFPLCSLLHLRGLRSLDGAVTCVLRPQNLSSEHVQCMLSRDSLEGGAVGRKEIFLDLG